MPNRIIKESICYSDDIDQLTPFEETVFYRLIVNVDDYGRTDGRISLLKSRLFVTKKGITEKNIEDAILKLASVGLVRRYKVSGKPFLSFPKWELHQTVRNKRSKFPEPPKNESKSDELQAIENICTQLQADVPVIQSESESKSIGDFFESIWEIYPKKRGKDQVSDNKKAKLYELGFDHLSRCIKRYVAEKESTDIQYLQNGSTFFNSGYIDYLDENYTPNKGKEDTEWQSL